MCPLTIVLPHHLLASHHTPIFLQKFIMIIIILAYILWILGQLMSYNILKSNINHVVFSNNYND